MAHYANIQALRGVAACAVVWCHVSGSVSRNEWGDLGNAGVDLFFVISGFIMGVVSGIFTAPAEPRAFLAKRIIRVVPLYWLYTTLIVLALLVAPRLFNTLRLDPLNAIASYFFIPYPMPNGFHVPVLPVGWTLNLEAVFYVLVALTLFLRQRAVVLVAVLLAMGLSPLILQPEHWAHRWVSSPYYLEFLYGVLIAWLAIARGAHARPGLAWLMVGAGVVMVPILTTSLGIGIWGPAAALVVLGAVLLEPAVGARVPRWLLLVGDASYSIYLSHLFIARPLQLVWGMTIGKDLPALEIACVTIATAALGIVAYRLVEQPLLVLLRRQAHQSFVSRQHHVSNP